MLESRNPIGPVNYVTSSRRAKAIVHRYKLRARLATAKMRTVQELRDLCVEYKEAWKEWTSRAGEEHCGDGVRRSSPAPGAYIGPSFLLLSPGRPSGAALGPHIVRVEPVRVEVDK